MKGFELHNILNDLAAHRERLEEVRYKTEYLRKRIAEKPILLEQARKAGIEIPDEFLDVESNDKFLEEIYKGRDAIDHVLHHKTDWRWFDMGEYTDISNLIPSSDIYKTYPAEHLPYQHTAVTFSVRAENPKTAEFREANLCLFCSQNNDNGNFSMHICFRSDRTNQVMLLDLPILFVKNADATEWGLLFPEQKHMVGEREDASAVRMQATAVFSLMKVLACNNVYIEREKYPEALKKSQEKKGRIGGYTRHTLCVRGGDREVAIGGTGSHASPRLHFRRGHIRRYKSGITTWVRQHMVGRGPGFVDKDYKVESTTNE